VYFEPFWAGTVLVKSGWVSRMQVIASGHPASTQCSAIQLCMQLVQFGRETLWKIGSGIRNAGHCLWVSREHTMLSYRLHMQSGLIRYENAAEKLDWVSGFLDIASRRPGSTQYSASIQLHVQFCSIRYGKALVKLDQFTGLWDITSGHPGSKQSSANQLHMQFDSIRQGNFLVTLERFTGIWDIASGCQGSISCSFIQLHMELGSIRYGNILVKLDCFTGL
jgi:hypothetical protein